MGEGSGNSGQSAAAGASGDGGDGGATMSSEANGSDQTAPKVTSNENTPDSRSTFRGKFGEGIDGWDGENNDTFYAEANKQYDGLSKYKTDNQGINKKMIDTLNANPEAAGLFRDIMKGASLQEAVARNIDMDSIKPVDGDPDMDSWNEGLEGRKKTLAEREAYLKEVNDNSQLTSKEIVAFAKENSLDEDSTMKVVNAFDGFIANAVKGKVSKGDLNRYYRGMNADQEVADATDKATVDARNQKIEAVKEKDTADLAGDGVPVLNASNKEAPVKVASNDPWMQAIDHQSNKKRI
jgi:hypothetical protein